MSFATRYCRIRRNRTPFACRRVYSSPKCAAARRTKNTWDFIKKFACAKQRNLPTRMINMSPQPGVGDHCTNPMSQWSLLAVLRSLSGWEQQQTACRRHGLDERPMNRFQQLQTRRCHLVVVHERVGMCNSAGSRGCATPRPARSASSDYIHCSAGRHQQPPAASTTNRRLAAVTGLSVNVDPHRQPAGRRYSRVP